jgi:hypothetical protein
LLPYKYKGQEWLQDYAGVSEGLGDSDPEKILELTNEGYAHIWNGINGLPSFDPTSVNFDSENFTGNFLEGWVYQYDARYVHSCADLCSLNGYNMGFWALELDTDRPHCWCHDSATVCLDTISVTPYDDFEPEFAKFEEMSIQQQEQLLKGRNSSDEQSFLSDYNTSAKTLPRDGCLLYEERIVDGINSGPELTAIGWNLDLFDRERIIVFSTEPQIKFPNCSYGLDTLCVWDAMVANVSYYAGTYTQWKRHESVSYVDYGFIDRGIDTEYWKPCSLNGFTCDDYEHEQCGDYRNNSKDYCGFEWTSNSPDPDSTNYDDYYDGTHEKECFGVTSITYLTCQPLEVTLGASMGYLSYLELCVVVILAALVLVARGDKEDAYAVLVGGIKTSAREVAAQAVAKALEKGTNAMGDARESFMDGVRGRELTEKEKEYAKAKKKLRESAMKTKGLELEGLN